MLNNDFELNEDNNSTYNVNHQKGEDKTDELKLENISAKGGENMKELTDKIYSDCEDLLLHTRHIIADISHIAIHLDSIADTTCDFHEVYDEQLDDIHYHYEDIIIPNLDDLNQYLQDYQLDMAELDNDIHQLLGKTNYTTLDDYYGSEYCGDN